jgi:hypothetical protein
MIRNRSVLENLYTVVEFVFCFILKNYICELVSCYHRSPLRNNKQAYFDSTIEKNMTANSTVIDKGILVTAFKYLFFKN